MLKYRVGDKVRIHTLDWFEKNSQIHDNYYEYPDFYWHFASGSGMMTELCGKEFEIESYYSDSELSYTYGYIFVGMHWTFQDWML